MNKQLTIVFVTNNVQIFIFSDCEGEARRGVGRRLESGEGGAREGGGGAAGAEEGAEGAEGGRGRERRGEGESFRKLG